MSRNKRPNLFFYATKELSQDAVICWLLEWAGTAASDNAADEALRECGRSFTKALFSTWGPDWYPFSSHEEFHIELFPQEKNIDILAHVNNKYVLLIEDKTGTGTHDNQLRRYWNAVVGGETQVGPKSEESVFPIYLKTGNQSLFQARKIRNSGYAVFERADFLRILDEYDGEDQILVDYRAHLREIEDRTSSYARWMADSTSRTELAWEGLYRRIEKCFLAPAVENKDIEAWGTSNRQRGGFTGVGWKPKTVDDVASLWFGRKEQGDEAELAFMLVVDDPEQRSSLQRQWHESLMSAGGTKVSKPGRMRAGHQMTIGVWAGEVLEFGEDGLLHLSRTINNLKSATDVLCEAAQGLGSP